MRAGQNAVLSALQRADGFIEENLAQLTTTVDLTGARRRLEDIVASFAGHAFDQNANDRDAKGETAKQQQLQLTLTRQSRRLRIPDLRVAEPTNKLLPCYD